MFKIAIDIRPGNLPNGECEAVIQKLVEFGIDRKRMTVKTPCIGGTHVECDAELDAHVFVALHKMPKVINVKRG